MTLPPPSTSSAAIAITITIILSSFTPLVTSLGSASTIAISYGSATICGIVAGEPFQRIQCYRGGHTISILPNISFESISGARTFFCGLRSGGFSILCWDTSYNNYNNTNTKSFQAKRIYFSKTVRLTDLTVGDSQVCALEIKTGIPKCWRGGSAFPSPEVTWKFSTITSGSGFSCGILKSNGRVLCWGSNTIGAEIERQFSNLSLISLVAGESHACGFVTNPGILICKGNNESGQLNVPSNAGFEYSSLALGSNHSCAILRRNGVVVCWGGGLKGFEFDINPMRDVSFESIVASLDFTCGLTTTNLSMICWGPRWSSSVLPLAMMVPGPCVEASCSICGVYPNSETLCDGNGNICRSCDFELPFALPLPPIPGPEEPPSSENLSPVSLLSIARNRLLLAFAVVGSVGAFAGICTIVYCIWCSCGFGDKKNGTNSLQVNIARANLDTGLAAKNGSMALASRSSSIRQQSSGRLRRQRSGTSSEHGERAAEKFSLPELSLATNNFSLHNRIGGGSFGIVYKGKLSDGREVAIKKGETSSKVKKVQENDRAFDSELIVLSRLHHKHLVDLIGFCEEDDERLLVYEFMSNGSLYDHLHNKDNISKNSSMLNSWRMRIKIALDAARGIEYLHNYAVPPIIHRDIKSSNILLDSNWTAKVSDFGLSLMGSESDKHVMMATKAVGTVGYIDPEYYVLNVLTAKSDVYGLGVVLLELLTGKKAVFKDDKGAGPMGIVSYAEARISAGEVWKVLDMRVGLPEVAEAEAIELVAYTALRCVDLEGKNRPSVSDIVSNLERASALYDGTHGGISTTTFSYLSE